MVYLFIICLHHYVWHFTEQATGIKRDSWPREFFQFNSSVSKPLWEIRGLKWDLKEGQTDVLGGSSRHTERAAKEELLEGWAGGEAVLLLTSGTKHTVKPGSLF